MSPTCYDAPNKAQIPSIVFEVLTPPDDSPDKPDQRDDGFWPSRDPNAAGYVEPDKFDSELAKAHERMDAFERGDWQYVGVRVRAVISLPMGGGSFVEYTLTSPGLWGVESDCADYIAEVAEEEKAQLLAHIADMGEAARALMPAH
jgi:hypothetical protein